MSGFNLTAKINAQGPFNIKPVVDKLKSSLKNVKGSIDISMGKNTQTTLSTVSRQLTEIEAKMKSISSMNIKLSSSFDSTSSSVKKTSSAAQAANKSLSKSNVVLAKTARGAAEAATELEEFGRVSGLAIRRFAGFTIATGAIFGVINSFSQGIREAIAFERQIVKVSQVTKTSISNLSPLTDEISRLSKNLGTGSDKLSEISLVLSQAGFSAADTRKALEALAKSDLAPTFTNIIATTEGSIAALRQFKLEVGDLESALGSVNSVAANFAVESDDIIAAVRRTGGVFAAASQGTASSLKQFQQFIALFTSVRSTTRESSESIATGLRTIFTRIQRRSTIENLQKLGIELVDTEGKFIGVFQAIKKLSSGLSGLDPRDVRFSAITEELGGFRQIGKTIPLIQRFATAQEALQVAQDGTNSLTEDAEKAQQSLQVQIQKTQEVFLEFTRNLTQSGTFKAVAGGVLSVTRTVVNLADNLQPVLPLLAAFATFKVASGAVQFFRGFGKGAKGQASPTEKVNQAAIQSRSSNTRAIQLNTRSAAVSANNNQQAAASSSSSLSVNTSAINTNTSAIRALTNAMGSFAGIKGKFGNGGKVQRFATGGMVQGKGNGDKQPILAEAGEFVMSRKGVQSAGLATLQKFNNGGKASINYKELAKKISDEDIARILQTPGINITDNVRSKLNNPAQRNNVLRGIKAGNPDLPIQDMYAKLIGTTGDKLAEALMPKKAFMPSVETSQGPLSAMIVSSQQKRIKDEPTISVGAKDLQDLGILSSSEKKFMLPFYIAGLQKKASEDAIQTMHNSIKKSVVKTARSLVPNVDDSSLISNLKNKSKIDFESISGGIFESALSTGLGLNQTNVKDNFDFTSPSDAKKLEGLFGPLPVEFIDAKINNTADARKDIRKKTIKQLKQDDGITSIVRNFVASQRGMQERASGGSGDGIPALTTPGEMVFSPQAVKRIGERNLQRFNSTGSSAGLNIRKSDYSVIPGSGNSDTFRTTLDDGSYVIRKSSSQGFRGQGAVKRFAMGGPVRRFAKGGGVNRSPIRTAARIDGGQETLKAVSKALIEASIFGADEIRDALKSVARGIIKTGGKLDNQQAAAIARGTLKRRRVALGAPRQEDIVFPRSGPLSAGLQTQLNKEARNPGDSQARLDSTRGLPEASQNQLSTLEMALQSMGHNVESVGKGLESFRTAIRGGETVSKAHNRAIQDATKASLETDLKSMGNNLYGVQKGLKEFTNAIGRGESVTIAHKRATEAAARATERRNKARGSLSNRANRAKAGVGGFLKNDLVSGIKSGFQSVFKGRPDVELESATSNEERRQILRDRKSQRTQFAFNAAVGASVLLPGILEAIGGEKNETNSAISAGVIGASVGGSTGFQIGETLGLGAAGGIVGGVVGAGLSAIDAAQQARISNAQEALTSSTEELNKAFKDFRDATNKQTTQRLNDSLVSSKDALIDFNEALNKDLNLFGSTQSAIAAAGAIYTGNMFESDKNNTDRDIIDRVFNNIVRQANSLDRRLAAQSDGALGLILNELTGDFKAINASAESTRKTFARNLVEQSKGQRDIAMNIISSELKRGKTVDEINKKFGRQLSILALGDEDTARKVSDISLETSFSGGNTKEATLKALNQLARPELERIFNLEREKNAIEEATQSASRRIELLSLRFNELAQASQFALTAGGEFTAIINNIASEFKSIQKFSIRGISDNIGFETQSNISARNSRNNSLLGNSAAGKLLGGIESTLSELESIGPELFRQAAAEATIKQNKGVGLSPEELALDLFNRLDSFKAAPDSFKDAFTDSFRKVFATRQGGGPEALTSMLQDDPERLLDVIRTSIGKSAINARKNLDKAFEEIANNFVKGANVAVKAQLQAAQIRGKADELIQKRGDLINSSRGFAAPRVGAVSQRLSQRVQGLTSSFGGNRVNSVAGIIGNIKDLQAERTNLEQQRQGANTVESQKRLTNAIANNQMRLDQNNKALNLVATSNERLGAVQSELADIEKRKQAGRALTERLATAQLDPKTNMQLQKEITGAFAVLGRGKLGVGGAGGQEFKDAVALLRQLSTAIGGDQGKKIDDAINNQIGKIASKGGGLPALLRNSLKPQGGTDREKALIENIKTITGQQVAALQGQAALAEKQAVDINANITNLTNAQIAELRRLTDTVSADLKNLLAEAFKKQKERGDALRESRAQKERESAPNQNEFAKLVAEDPTLLRRMGVQTKNRGGFVGGPFKGNKDTALTALTPGEFVVKRNMAQRFSSELQMMNSGMSPSGRGSGSVNIKMDSSSMSSMNNFANSAEKLSKALGAVSGFADASAQLARASQALASLNIPSKIIMEIAPIQVNVIHNGAEVLSKIHASIGEMVEAKIADAMSRHINAITGETKETLVGSPAGR